MEIVEEKKHNLNDIWENIKKAKEEIAAANERYKEVTEEDLGIFDDWKIYPEIQKAKNVLVRRAVEQTFKKNKIRNIRVKENIEEQFKERDFREEDIEKYITDLYLKNANKIAYDQILSKAQMLLPTVFNERNLMRKTEAADILEKKKISLKIFWHYGAIDYYEQEKIDALEKLINILILGEEPAKTEGKYISNEIRRFRTYEDHSQARHYIFENGVLTGFKIFKNGKFQIQFTMEEEARKIAEELTKIGDPLFNEEAKP